MPKILDTNVKMLIELHPWRPFLEPQQMDELLTILEHKGFRARFVVFEDKVEENKIIRLLLKKAGSKLPILASDISIRELRKMLTDNPRIASPNVLFQKGPEFCIDN